MFLRKTIILFVCFDILLVGVLFWFTKVENRAKYHVLTNQKQTLHTITQNSPYQKWLMLAGDSNMRKTYYVMLNVFENELKLHDTQLFEVILSKLDNTKDSNWFDQDFVLVFKNTSNIRVSLRFLHGKYWELHRLNKNWSDIRFCGLSCNSNEVLPSKQDEIFSVPHGQKPDLLFITRGLWDMDEIKQNTSCKQENEYGKIIKSLNSEVKLVWLNNPKIEWHSKIKNWQIEHDVKCQRQYAKQHGIKVFDMFDYVSQNMTERMTQGEYHITLTARHYLFNLMWRTLWEG